MVRTRPGVAVPPAGGPQSCPSLAVLGSLEPPPLPSSQYSCRTVILEGAFDEGEDGELEQRHDG